MQKDSNAVADQHRNDREKRGEGHQAVATAKLEHLGADQPRPGPLSPRRRTQLFGGGGGGGGHSGSPSRVVISRKRSSRDARAGSRRYTVTPVSTSSRLISPALA